MATIAAINIALGMITTGFESGTKKAGRELSELKNQVGELAGPLAGLAAGAASVYTIHKALEAAAAEHASMRNLNTVLATTGEAAGLSGKQIEEFAHGLQETTRFSHVATEQAAAVLATFTNIKGEDIFKGAIKSAQDMSTLLGTDLQENIKLVGRALNDPVGGMNRLQRAGISLDPALRDTIKHMAQMGNVAGAQEKLLGALDSKYHGLAAAAGQGLGGTLARLGNDLEDLRAKFGKVLEPWFLAVANAISDTKAYHDVLVEITTAATIFAGVMTAIVTIEKLWTATAAIRLAFTGPKGWAQLAIAAGVAAGAVYYLHTKFKELKEETDTSGEKGSEAVNNMGNAADALREKLTPVEKIFQRWEDELDDATMKYAGWTDANIKYEQVLRDIRREEGDVSDEDKKHARDLSDQAELVEEKKKQFELNKKIADFQTEAAEANLDHIDKEMAHLKALATTKEQIAKIEAAGKDLHQAEQTKKDDQARKEKAKKDEEDAKRIKEHSDPMSKFKDEAQRIKELVEAGNLTAGEGSTALDKAFKDEMKSFKNDSGKGGTGAFLQGSTAAYSAEQAAARQANPMQGVTKLQRDQITILQQQLLATKAGFAGNKPPMAGGMF